MDADDVQTVKQVLAEAPFLHAVFQILVGGGNDAHVGFHLFVPAHAVKLAVLQHAQQSCLQARRHVADLVQEQGAAVGLFEAALALMGGAGERPLFMTEELGFEQLAGNGGDVDCDERLVGARTVIMQGARH
jgi:hypothetical protein